MADKNEIHQLVLSQKEFFLTHQTLDVSFRIASLKKLKKAIIEHEEEISLALKADLNRSETEAYLTDIGPSILEINEYIKGVRKWHKPERHYSGLLAFPSIWTKVYKMPYGVSLIISPFNFPILLSFGVLAAAIAGGNTAIIKTSSKSANCSSVMEKIIAKTFPKEYVSVVTGGHDVADYLLAEKVDKIFYTGSPNIGKHVMEMASKNLVPVALELGGENGNWAIVRKDADIKDAARKIAFFKITNAGQICININQVGVAREIAPVFLEALKNEFIRQIGENASRNIDYPKLISQKAFLDIDKEAKKYMDRIYFGGEGDINSGRFSPTIIYPVNEDEEIVNHEIFGPLLPIVPFDDERVDDLLDKISRREHGLAFYLFTKDKKWAKKTMSSQQYGGGCVNEVCLHIMVKGVPFNGVGHSGMGAYHGIWGYKEFTHPSTVLFGSSKFNLAMREHPYNKKKKNLIKKFLK